MQTGDVSVKTSLWVAGGSPGFCLISRTGLWIRGMGLKRDYRSYKNYSTFALLFQLWELVQRDVRVVSVFFIFCIYLDQQQHSAPRRGISDCLTSLLSQSQSILLPLSLIVAPSGWVLASFKPEMCTCQLLPIILFPQLVPAARPLVLTDSCILSLAALNASEIRTVISATKLSKSLTLLVVLPLPKDISRLRHRSGVQCCLKFPVGKRAELGFALQLNKEQTGRSLKAWDLFFSIHKMSSLFSIVFM